MQGFGDPNVLHLMLVVWGHALGSSLSSAAQSLDEGRTAKDLSHNWHKDTSDTTCAQRRYHLGDATQLAS